MPILTDVEFSMEGEETRNALDGVFRAPRIKICPISVFQSGECGLVVCGPYVSRDGVLAAEEDHGGAVGIGRGLEARGVECLEEL